MRQIFPDLQLDGECLGAPSLLIAFHGLIPKLVKTFTDETKRAEEFLSAGFAHENVVVHSLLHANGRCFMEHHDATLDQLPSFACESHCDVLCKHMLAGLEYLHAQGYAHFDVKPSNIGIDGKGNFKQIDLCSIALINARSEATTDAFVPMNMPDRNGDVYVVTKMHDYYMLACTVLFKGGVLPTPNTTSRYTRETIRSALSSSRYANGVHVAALVSLLGDNECNITTTPASYVPTVTLPPI